MLHELNLFNILNKFKLFISIFIFLLQACTANTVTGLSALSNNLSASATPTPTTTTLVGTAAVKIYFSTYNGSNNGSFPPAPAGGTPVTPGSGLMASRLYNPDGSSLATGSLGSSSWPAWLSSFEIGVSGSQNSASLNTHCANFATSSESTAINCNIGPSPSPVPNTCGASVGQFRVSEVDCSVAGGGGPVALAGNGGSNDGIYFRANLVRSAMGVADNILVVLEYAASSLDPAPANPTSCFAGGIFSPENCSDFVWKVYLRHSTAEAPVQPFLLLVPPTFAAVLSAGQSALPQGSGTGVAAKQFVVPLAGDANLSVIQISRTQSNFPSLPNLLAYCTGSGATPGNSPLCAGMVFYSITLYRI